MQHRNFSSGTLSFLAHVNAQDLISNLMSFVFLRNGIMCSARAQSHELLHLYLPCVVCHIWRKQRPLVTTEWCWGYHMSSPGVNHLMIALMWDVGTSYCWGESCEHTMFRTIITLTGNWNTVLTCRVLGNCGPKVFAYCYKNMSLRDF